MHPMHALLKTLVDNKGSDLHLSAGMPPCMRIHGKITQHNSAPLNHEAIRSMTHDLLSKHQIKNFEENMALDCAIMLPGIARFRCNLFLQENGMGAVFRALPVNPSSFTELNLPNALRGIVHMQHGLVLVVGPTGSGKTTTLAALLDEINTNYPKHILTLEDPIEILHKSKNSLVNQREIGQHVVSFADGLRSALREDPDVILVGEMRDSETMGLAMTAAETGHIVFATLHVGSTHKTPDRIISSYPASQQAQVRTVLAESLSYVVAQTLLPAKNGGRVAAFEILVNTPAVANLIREGKTTQIISALQTGSHEGMITMKSYVENLFMQGKIAENVYEAYMRDLQQELSKEKAAVTKEEVQKIQSSIEIKKPPSAHGAQNNGWVRGARRNTVKTSTNARASVFAKAPESTADTANKTANPEDTSSSAVWSRGADENTQTNAPSQHFTPPAPKSETALSPEPAAPPIQTQAPAQQEPTEHDPKEQVLQGPWAPSSEEAAPPASAQMVEQKDQTPPPPPPEAVSSSSDPATNAPQASASEETTAAKKAGLLDRFKRKA